MHEFVKLLSTLSLLPRTLPISTMPVRKKVCALKAKFDHDFDSLHHAATEAALLRFHESNRPDPLFVDLYAGCIVDPGSQLEIRKHSSHYCLATKLVDDELLQTISQINGLKQVILLTDGMDSRPYRLNWPLSTVIYDVSPDRLFNSSNEKLKDVGATTSKGCSFHHLPFESSNLHHAFCERGFKGNLPSIWVMQGLPVMNLESFEEIMFLVSSLAMKGSMFMGELPSWLAGINASTNWIETIFMKNGFRLKVVPFDELAKSLGRELAPVEYKNVLFVAEQMYFSDDQMNEWREEFQRVVEEGDEEGFEEL